jgi:hypothetical protein
MTMKRELPAKTDRVESKRATVPPRRAIDREEASRRDLRMIRKHAARLNREAADVLGYQRPW